MDRLAYLLDFNIYGIISVVVALSFLIVGSVVIAKNQNEKIKLSVGFLFTSFFIWCLGSGFGQLVTVKKYVYAFHAFSAFGFSFIWTAIIAFFITLPSKKLEKWEIAVILINLALSCYVLWGVLFSDDYPLDYVRTANSWSDKPNLGSIHFILYEVLVVFWIVQCLLLAIRFTVKAKKNNNKIQIKQAKIIFSTGIVSLLPSILTNHILNILGFNSVPWGSDFIAIWIFGIGYAVTKYKFLVPTIEYAAREIFRISGEIMLVTDLHLNITELNDSCSDKLGYTYSEMKRMNIRSLFSSYSDINEENSKNIAKLKLDLGDRCIYTKNRKKIYVHIKTAPIFDHEIAIGILFVFADVTELYQQNEILEKKVQVRTKQIRRQLSIMQKYTRQSLVQDIRRGEDPTQYKPKEEPRAVFFNDIRNFTKLSENMTAMDTIMLLNSYFNEMCNAVIDNNGEIDKLIGDCIMALFTTSDDAVRCAIDIQKKVKLFNKRPKMKDRYKITNGTGINYGIVNIGNIGSDKKLDYTVIGDVVNSACRFESLTKQYHVPVIISEDVVSALTGTFDIRFLDETIVKGKQKPLRIYEVYDFEPETIKKDREQTKNDFEECYTFYHSGNFSKAKEMFTTLNEEMKEAKMQKDPIIDVFIKRCIELQRLTSSGQLEEWDGIYQFNEK